MTRWGWWGWLATAPRQRSGLRVLQGAIGAMLLFRMALEARYALYLWGPNGLGLGSTQPVLGPTLGGMADRLFTMDASTLAVVVVLVISALCLLLGWHTQWASVFALVAFSLIDARLPELIDRGDTAARLMLFYLLLTLPFRSAPAPSSVVVWIHNLGVLAIAMQAMTLYAIAGLMKAAGPEWYEGTALYYISQVESLSLPALRGIFRDPFVTTAASYFTVLYEALFPIAMLSRLRLTWIAVGVAFHVGIGVFLGIISFSIVMIAIDLFFLTDAEYAWIAIRARLGWTALRRRLVSLARRVPGPARAG
jgi:hypothetical protein